MTAGRNLLQQLVEPGADRGLAAEMRGDPLHELGKSRIECEIFAELHQQDVFDEQLARASPIPLLKSSESRLQSARYGRR